MNITDEISILKGVGKKAKEQLNNLNIFTINDLLTFYPRTYEDRRTITNISGVKEGENYTIKAVIKQNPVNIRKSITVTKAIAEDDTGKIEVTWYNRPFIKKTIVPYAEYYFYGKCVRVGNKIVMQSPDIEDVENSTSLSSNRIVPIYSIGKNISQKQFRKFVHLAISCSDQYPDFFTNKIIKDYELISKKDAIKNIHFPVDDDYFFKSRYRLVFEEIFLTRCNLLNIKEMSAKKSTINNINTDSSELLKLLPFELTNAQKKVIEDIKRDINSDFTMNRLIQGDVGSGKTAIAQIASFILLQNDYQCVLMAPTEVLARQHYESFSKLYESFGIKVVFLAGSLTAKQKRIAYEGIKNNEYQMIIGTHAIIQDKVKFYKLGLVITDEQHRFGVRQRQVLTEKGENPHILVMTATPIPRTLGLILYGDLDVSVIDELPPNRKSVKTYNVTSKYLPRIYEFMRKEINEGRQVYAVCPLIEESEDEKSKLVSVYEFADNIRENLPEFNVESLQGKMKQVEKDEIMDRFSSGETKILVSTTVIEVGINVPNASLMVIINAERFGLSQLHQLRGRVGRGSDKSYCILVSDSKGELTKNRLNVICESSDGFVISEKDLQLRGHGDFFGTRQHGIPDFKITNIFSDIDIVAEVENLHKQLNDNDYISKGEKKLIDEQLNKYNETFFKEITL